jgi:hypothetical protein
LFVILLQDSSTNGKPVKNDDEYKSKISIQGEESYGSHTSEKLRENGSCRNKKVGTEDDRNREDGYGTHQRLVDCYRERATQDVSKLLFLCDKKMVPMNVSCIERGKLSSSASDVVATQKLSCL